MIKIFSYFNLRYKDLGLLLLTIATSFYAYGQEPTEDEQINLLLDEFFFNEDQFITDILGSKKTKNYIYANTTYNSNTFFSGRDPGIDQFSLIPQISYYHSSGFNINISGMYYEKYTPNWDFSSVYLGYFNRFGKKKLWHLSAGYTRYFYNDSWDIFTNSLETSIGIRDKKHKFGISLTTSYLFGNDQSLQLIPSTYTNLSLTKQKKFRLDFKPTLSFIIAKQTIALEQLNTQGDASLISYDIFDLLNTQINLPLSFTSKNWDVGLGYNINLPSAVATESNLDPTGFFKVSIGYLIDFDTK